MVPLQNRQDWHTLQRHTHKFSHTRAASGRTGRRYTGLCREPRITRQRVNRLLGATRLSPQKEIPAREFRASRGVADAQFSTIFVPKPGCFPLSCGFPTPLDSALRSEGSCSLAKADCARACVSSLCFKSPLGNRAFGRPLKRRKKSASAKRWREPAQMPFSEVPFSVCRGGPAKRAPGPNTERKHCWLRTRASAGGVGAG